MVQGRVAAALSAHHVQMGAGPAPQGDAAHSPRVTRPANATGTAILQAACCVRSSCAPLQMAAVAEQLREQGNNEFRSGDFLKAAATYTRALKADPNNVLLYR